MSQTPTTLQTVTAARKHFSAARQIERNLRLGRYNGRNSAATSRGLDRHMAQAWKLVDTLPRGLQGLLAAEHKLSDRLAQAAEQNQPRPELKTRLISTRREIKGASH